MVQPIMHFNKVDQQEFAEEEEEEYVSLSKRPRLAAVPLNNQWGFENPSQYNPLDEPSPLGLRLKKSPSLLDFIQMKLSQGSSNASVSTVRGQIINSRNKNGVNKGIANDKLKASNFPALFLRIGTWEYMSKYEGDLVVKFYFAKHKLVWEVLEGGLKSKIEIQWADIAALKAECPDNAPGTLTLVLAGQPIFFRETNPQPRKHTLWHATSDFTDGQASIYKQHYIQCPPGVLDKHYEKLMQCDLRLRSLSQQPEKVMCSLYFESQASGLENPDELKGDGCNQLQYPPEGTPSSVFENAASAAPEQFSSFSLEQSPMATQHVSKDVPSPSSVMDTHATEGNRILDERRFEGISSWESSEVPGLRPSTSMSDLMNQFVTCISEQMTSGSLSSDKSSECQDMVENIAQVLLCDTQIATGLDERSLMKKVNSLCCLLQDPVATSNAHVGNWYESAEYGKNVTFDLLDDSMHQTASNISQGSEGYLVVGPGGKRAPTIPRRDSLGDLLLHLPRIASLPKFLFGIEEDDKCQNM